MMSSPQSLPKSNVDTNCNGLIAFDVPAPTAGPTPKYTIPARHEAARGRYRTNGIFTFRGRHARKIFPMNHKGVEYALTRTEAHGVWKWQFRIGERVKTGRTKARPPLLAMRRSSCELTADLGQP